MPNSYFHLHLVSDATGETLIAVSRAVAAQFDNISSIEHLYPLVRSAAQLDSVIAEIEAAPGMVLFTLVDLELAEKIEAACRAIGAPCLSVLHPILTLFQSYLGAAANPRPGAQHILNADYFKRIDALNYTMMHDDGQMVETYDEADVLLIGVSRSSKTPTSIYLANRGIKTANIPMVPNVPLPKSVFSLKHPLIVGLIASPERIIQIRQNRLEALHADPDSPYVDRLIVCEEVAQSRRLFVQYGWAVIDVTRRSIEETAAAIIDLYRVHRAKFGPDAQNLSA
ncbi:pyruvate, water dikinase regulatory protein [Methylovirgula sp. HY1]|uniref:pyruvate, water dikinase regulatory protein n=1 Tax=Methylovirgula sp. HY1 TaxID=2822761 RepID=UPI001C5BD8E5|nr:pyruvate, water dikinase regulatory protein [Methylovirgula sp. HY1]QXX75489.1 Putative pyruvate, phosphate dikinase regulatory protein [Methylovirgula sp. HY1]